MSKTFADRREVAIDCAVDFACPFCEGIATIGYIHNRPAALHSLPTCKTYDELNPLEFAIAVEKRLDN